MVAFEGCGNRIWERCEGPPRSPRLREKRSFGIGVCFNIGCSDAFPLTAVVFRLLCTMARTILPWYLGRRTYAAVAQRQRGCFVSSGFTVRIRAAAPPPLQDDPMLSGWLKVSGTAHNGCRSSVPCEKTSGQTAAECLDTSTFSSGWHALR